MAIPRRLLVIAVGAAATGAVLYIRNRLRERDEKPAAARSGSSHSSPTAGSPTSATQTPPSSTGEGAKDAGPPGSRRELSLFLAGESWYDEVGWQGIWEREAIESPEGWLRSVGKEVLVGERKKLADHPALLAGCRRRWIVVCRYAGVDVGDAAALWNTTEAA